MIRKKFKIINKILLTYEIKSSYDSIVGFLKIFFKKGGAILKKTQFLLKI